jgi:hypothetical protein
MGHLERELVNGSGKGSCKIMIEFFNVVLILLKLSLIVVALNSFL